jgi:predicted kinase
MKKVIIPRGIPGAGKTTWVKNNLASHTPGTAVRISNDDLSAMLFAQPWGAFFSSDTIRETLGNLRLSMLETFLKQDGIEVIYIDNTNLAMKTVRSLEKLAHQYCAEVIINDDFLSVPIEECIERDAKRPSPVGENIIRKMHKDAARLRPWKSLPTHTPKKHVHDPALPMAVLVDIDGTLAIKGDRGIYDFANVEVDLPNEPVIRTVQTLMDDGLHIIVMSGRQGSCEEQTRRWLDKYVHPGLELHMRAAGDQRPDYIVKNELFEEHVAGKYNILLSLDDRDSVVDLWRNKMGIPTFQVAEGDF